MQVGLKDMQTILQHRYHRFPKKLDDHKIVLKF